MHLLHKTIQLGNTQQIYQSKYHRGNKFKEVSIIDRKEIKIETSI